MKNCPDKWHPNIGLGVSLFDGVIVGNNNEQAWKSTKNYVNILQLSYFGEPYKIFCDKTGLQVIMVNKQNKWKLVFVMSWILEEKWKSSDHFPKPMNLNLTLVKIAIWLQKGHIAGKVGLIIFQIFNKTGKYNVKYTKPNFALGK
jgi:hypothetical protein